MNGLNVVTLYDVLYYSTNPFLDMPHNVGAVGAAVTIAVGSGEINSFGEAKKLIPVVKIYEPDPANKPVYDKQFAVFKKLYQANKKNFAALNG